MRVIVVVVLAVSAVLVTSPDACAQAVSVAIKGGLAFTTVEATGEGAYEANAETSGAIGIALPITFAPRLRFQPELLFSTQRFSVDSNSTTVHASANAISIPLLLSVTAVTNSGAAVMFYGGPQFTRINDVKQTVFDVEMDVSDQIKDMDVGLTFGASAEFNLPRGAIVVEIRGTRGFRDLNDGPTEIKSRSMMLLAGYRF